MKAEVEELPWEEFDKLHAIRRLRQIVGNQWKIQVNFTDHHGYLRGVPAGKFFNPIHHVCKRITSDSRGFQGCIAAVRKTAGMQQEKIEFGQCHAGFSTIAVPISVQNRYLGCVFCDGFIVEETQAEQKKQIKATLNSLFPSDQQIQSYVEQLPVLNKKEVDFLTQLIEMVVEEIILAYAGLWGVRKEVDHLKIALTSRYSFANMIGKSDAMQRLYSLVERVKDAVSIVLIQGENGTGKELIARALHYNSKRRKEPFIAVSCGAFNENLLESELFGHVKGSFTGAIKDKIGLFEAANDGTLFLDEVGETSQTMQVKLLRVLQEGTFRPVGSNENRETSARVICATNRDLTKMLEEGQFRKDLYYRLNVINLVVPPLRERPEDIPLLIEHFVRNFAEKMGTKEKKPSKECLQSLLAYQWPGNVRELENEIERLYVLAGEDSTLVEMNLSPRLHGLVSVSSIDLRGGKLRDVLEQVESEIIKEGLKRTRWNKSQLAKELGISRAGLILKVEKYGLERKAS